MSTTELPTAEELFATCPKPEAGCFASDPEAFEYMMGYHGDSSVNVELGRLAKGATEAGEQGIAIEDATYLPMTIETVREYDLLDKEDGNHPVREVRLGHGEPSPVLQEQEAGNQIGELRNRIARCAHACGAAGVGACPVLVKSYLEE